MEYAYQITTQNVEEYGENFYKYKGGSVYYVTFEVTQEIFEKDAYGEGVHDYYNVPSLTEATATALVMQHVNRYNGLYGSFDYVTGCETIHPSDIEKESMGDNSYFFGTVSDLVADIDNSRELHYDNHGELSVTP